MVKIIETKGRLDTNSGYAYLFSNQQLGQLMSRVHVVVIQACNELDVIIEAEIPVNISATLDSRYIMRKCSVIAYMI
jgi:hypothetical protein